MPQLGLDVQLIHLDQGHNYSLAIIKAERCEAEVFLTEMMKRFSKKIIARDRNT